MENEKMTLFDIDDTNDTNDTNDNIYYKNKINIGNTSNLRNIGHTGQIEVVRAEFIEVETLSWQEVFDGFDKMYAITYSSSMDFICQLIKQFKQVEIIFGYEGVLSYNIQEIIAYQSNEIKRIIKETIQDNIKDTTKNKLDLLSRIDDGSLNLRVAIGQLSHEKTYLLESKDGRKRVIMGSANMSKIAFSGKQRENICYMDGDAAFDWYYGVYTRLRVCGH